MGGRTNCQHEGYCIPDDCELLKKKTALCYARRRSATKTTTMLIVAWTGEKNNDE